MKKFLFLLIVIGLIISACAPVGVDAIEQSQQKAGNMAIVQNQPIPDLGGYSFERDILIQTYIARNNTISTYAYMFTMDGKIVEICPSIGYPIPYSTQLTSPMKVDYNYSITLPNAEPNSLYPPGDAAATLVQCVNEDGTVSPVYNEWYVLAFPYRIQSDYQIQKISDSSFKVDINQ
jgi:hypothetical protein